MKLNPIRTAIAAALLTSVAVPAGAQMQSDSYKFLKAVRDQNVLQAKELFDKPGSTVINSRDYSTGETALHVVIKRRDLGWINFLANAGANLETRDQEGRTPLILAAQLGFVDGVRVLLTRGADVNGTNSRGESALIYAVQARDATTVRVLIDGGADPDQQDRFTGNSARDYAKADSRSANLLKIMENAKPKKKSGSTVIFGPQ